MFRIKSFTRLKFLCIVLSLEGIKCSIDGSLPKPRRNNTKAVDDPCNPLYWYPRSIPEYCNFRRMSTPPTGRPPQPIPIPIPVPLPAPLPMPMPIIPPPVVPPIMMPPNATPPGPPLPIVMPHPIMPLPIPLPFGIPLAPTNPMVPVAGIPLPHPPPAFPVYSPQYPLPYPPHYGSPYPPPYGSPYPQPLPPYPSPFPGPFPSPYPMPPLRGIGMVPGIPGLVSPDGGINIMPFSDVYSDMLQKHKDRMIRRRLQKMLNDYERPPWKSSRKTRRHGGDEDEDKKNENEID